MQLEQIFEKIGRAEPLTAGEQSELRDQIRAIDEVKNLVKSWVVPGTNLPIFQPPIEVIYSIELNEDMAVVHIPIPNKFNHLMIFGAGRTTGAGTATEWLHAYLSGDTGNNYINQFFLAISTALSGVRVTGSDHGVIGSLCQGGRPAGDVGSFFTVIPHYQNSTLNKNSMTLATPAFGSFFGAAANWDSVEPITSLDIFPAADSIAAGSIISVYGIL